MSIITEALKELREPETKKSNKPVTFICGVYDNIGWSEYEVLVFKGDKCYLCGQYNGDFDELSKEQGLEFMHDLYEIQECSLNRSHFEEINCSYDEESKQEWLDKVFDGKDNEIKVSDLNFLDPEQLA